MMFDNADLFKKYADIEKAAFVLSLIIERPEFVKEVSFKDPFVKTDVFDEENIFNLHIKFKDDGTMKKKLRAHIDEMESSVLSQLEQIKKEKKNYD